MGTGPCNPDFMTIRPDVAAQLPTVDTTTQAFKDFSDQVEPVAHPELRLLDLPLGRAVRLLPHLQGRRLRRRHQVQLPRGAGVRRQAAGDVAAAAQAAGAVGRRHRTHRRRLLPRQERCDVEAALDVGGRGRRARRGIDALRGEQFFDDYVMPIFLKRGCALEACHSPGSANDFKLRAGTQGFVSRFSLHSNYDAARREFLVPDVPDVRQSRLVKKPVVSVAEGGFGLTHRGGPPLQSPGEVLDPALCPQPFPTDGSATPFCTVVEWHKRERAALLAASQADAMAVGLVAADRRGLAPARRRSRSSTSTPSAPAPIWSSATSTLGATGDIEPASATVTGSLLANCPRGGGANVDVRHPVGRVRRVEGRLRHAHLGATDTLDIYEVTLDAAHTCTKVTDGNGMSKNGILLHNPDPMYAPDGTLVFASTRGRHRPDRRCR